MSRKRREKKLGSSNGLVKSIENGLRIVSDDYDAYKSADGIRYIKRFAEKYPRKNRPGIGLYKGFSEFLMYKDPDEDRLIDSIKAIEKYFNEM